MTNSEYKTKINIDNKNYKIFNLIEITNQFNLDLTNFPITLRILLENCLRNSHSDQETTEIIQKFKNWQKKTTSIEEIAYHPYRVLMQDFTGVPAVVDLASMRDAVQKNGADAKKINPISPVDLVIDHSIQVDKYATSSALQENTSLEIKRNIERYKFLKWGQKSFDNFRVVPPGTGICHQVNLEYLGQIVANKDGCLVPDTLVGTDSHTTMINGLGILGWGVGGIEAESAMLGNSISMIIPEVIGFKLTGKLKEGITATDLVLTITEILRKEGVVGKFVEFFGESLQNLSLADRATIANMSPEFGSTCAFFPVDEETLKYLDITGRSKKQIRIVEEYSKAQKLWHNINEQKKYTKEILLDLDQVEPSVAGPSRPQDRVSLKDLYQSYQKAFGKIDIKKSYKVTEDDKGEYEIKNGDIIIAAITSCTNTSNPAVMIAAGLVAKKALAFGLKPKPYVKTSLAPGSQVVTDYYKKSGLEKYLDEFGFNNVGYGCTTCIGNSGPLHQEIADAIQEHKLTMASILSGNRNFEGRVHPLVKASYLASPPLVVAYSILGTVTKDILKDSLGKDENGNDVFLKDIWPSNQEINELLKKSINREMFINRYSHVLDGSSEWQKMDVQESETYQFNQTSTYIQNPPFFENFNKKREEEIKNANILAIFGDSITTDHISPAGAIAGESPAAVYLAENGVEPADFNSYGSRRGNHEVMIRGTFANIRIKNEMVGGDIEGGYTIYDHQMMSIYEAAMEHQKSSTPLVIIAGKDYGAGSSRDWAAKGTLLLGIKAIIAESFERIHRSNLVGMGVLPLVFQNGKNRKSLNLTGKETITIDCSNIVHQGEIKANISYEDGKKEEIILKVRIDTEFELDNFNNGGVLQSMVKKIIA